MNHNRKNSFHSSHSQKLKDARMRRSTLIPKGYRENVDKMVEH
jgi:hypothetical protein